MVPPPGDEARAVRKMDEPVLSDRTDPAIADADVAPEPVHHVEPTVEPTKPDLTIEAAIRTVYQLSVKRTPVIEEIDIWLNNFNNGLPFHQFLLLMLDGDEARRQSVNEAVGAGKSDGDFVLDLYRHILGRGCAHYEIEGARRRLEAETVTRTELIREYFKAADAQERAGSDHAVHDGLSCWIMGTSRTITLDEWKVRAKDQKKLEAARKALRPATPYTLKAEPGIRVSAIASLYRGGDFVEQFLDNITTQTCFDRHCELIIIDAESPENEAEVIARYVSRYPNIRYKRMNYRIGIYEAWNVGIEMAQGKYLTNTNLDDLRREDSLEIQAGALESLPFVDVIYQDFYYSFDPALDWKGVAAFGYKSNVPPITHYNMLQFNSPHNAPMWRKSLHDELGLFNAQFKSAGDYEFWLRCLNAKKRFFKINEPHVVYYQNPKGLSTRADTRGIIEQKEIGRKYTPLLLPKDFFPDFDDFVHGILGPDADPADFPQRNRYAVTQKKLRAYGRRFKQEMQ
jgi:glycosyltransferase involved in cell wall biosynthesis